MTIFRTVVSPRRHSECSEAKLLPVARYL